jgi:pyrroloquinoline-quinone synthase
MTEVSATVSHDTPPQERCHAGFWDRVEQVQRYWDITSHPFYRRWAGGDLDAGELARYAGQYRHVVVAIARLSEAASRVAPDVALWDELEEHAAEERRHIELWDRFVNGVRGSNTAVPAPLTQACVQAWAPPRDRSLLGSLIALHVIEAAEPGVVDLEHTGLVRFYGLDEPSSTAYFRVHQALGLQHADDWRALIDAYWRPSKEAELLAEAENVFRGVWRLLDGLDSGA